MKIKKNQTVEIKGDLPGSRWQTCKASEDFYTSDTRWPLLNSSNKEFQPFSEKCKIRIIEADGKKKLIKYKSDSQVWDVIKEQISRSTTKRYNWQLIFGESLTKTVLRHKMNGLSHVEAYHIILEHPMVARICAFFPEERVRIQEKIQISVCARYGENNSALKLFNTEFRK